MSWVCMCGLCLNSIQISLSHLSVQVTDSFSVAASGDLVSVARLDEVQITGLKACQTILDFLVREVTLFKELLLQ